MATNRYANGKIYKLVNNVDDKVYVGSTCDTLPKRLYKHKGKAKLHPDRNVYKHFNIIGWDNVEIILIEKYPCNDNMELLKRERYWIDELKADLNKQKPTRTIKEYYEDNKDKISMRGKKYYEVNKDKINDQIKIYREENKEKIKQKVKKYREANLEKIQEYDRNRYEARKEKVKAHNSQPWTCDVCNCQVTLGKKSVHCKSQRHIKNLSK